MHCPTTFSGSNLSEDFFLWIDALVFFLEIFEHGKDEIFADRGYCHNSMSGGEENACLPGICGRPRKANNQKYNWFSWYDVSDEAVLIIL